MKLLDQFAENFPSSVDKYFLKREMYWSVRPCLFYGRLINCQCTYDKYTMKYCNQDQIMKCWDQESQPHFSSGITEILLNKFNKFY